MPRANNEVFRILADPTRRRILDLLAENGPLNVGQLACQFPDLVASGISKHLMGLRAVGLVTSTQQGRLRLYQVHPDALAEALAPWLAKYEPYWSASLERLGGLAEGHQPSGPNKETIRAFDHRGGLGSMQFSSGAESPQSPVSGRERNMRTRAVASSKRSSRRR